MLVLRVLRAACLFCLACSVVWSQDDWGAPEQLPRRRGVVGFLASLLGSWGFFKFFSGRKRLAKLKRKHELQLKQFQTEASRQIQLQLEPYVTALQQEQARLDILQDNIRMWETALFTLPDDDGNKLITPAEFNKYMASYKKLHPELEDRDLPRFRDMDYDTSGEITFEEWATYQNLITEQLLAQAQAQQQAQAQGRRP